MKLGRIKVSKELLGDLLELPKGVKIVAGEDDIPGVMEFTIEGDPLRDVPGPDWPFYRLTYTHIEAAMEEL